MESRVSSNFTDLIHKFAASCLLHPLTRVQAPEENHQENPEEEEEEEEEEEGEEEEEEEEEKGAGFCYLKGEDQSDKALKRLGRVEGLLEEVFEAVSGMKRAYQSLQEAHSPWDPLKMRVADVAVVAELRRLAGLRDRYRRNLMPPPPTKVVAEEPYSGATIEELRKEVMEKQEMVESLREKLKQQPSVKKKKKKKGKAQRKLSCREVAAAPTPELFESCMNQVKAASKSFTTLLLSLMRSSNWDIAAAIRSIEGGVTTTKQHRRYAVESYVCRKMFYGFENETFYIDGSLSSLIQPEKHRQDCFTQFCDMQSMDPVELLGILPNCHFGKFCAKKFLGIVHPKMEESFFGNLEQRRQVIAGDHPRSQFYCLFLGLAKAVWLLHRLAFALQPAPCHFQASKGAEFHPEYMESVVIFPGNEIPASHVVGFPVTPGFKIGGFVIKSRVYLVPRTWSWCSEGEKGII